MVVKSFPGHYVSERGEGGKSGGESVFVSSGGVRVTECGGGIRGRVIDGVIVGGGHGVGGGRVVGGVGKNPRVVPEDGGFPVCGEESLMAFGVEGLPFVFPEVSDRM